MKVTKTQLKRIIKEEVNANEELIRAIEGLAATVTNPGLIAAIKKLSGKIDNLDVSVDYLSAAVTGGDPSSVGGAQSARGRGAAPARKVKVSRELEEMIEEELEAMMGEATSLLDDPTDSAGWPNPGTTADIYKGAPCIQNTRKGTKKLYKGDEGYEDCLKNKKLGEVSSEKQRRWACAQKDKAASQRADSLSAAEAEEMCKSEVEEK